MTAAACQCLPILVTDLEELTVSQCKTVNRSAEPFFGSVQHAESHRKATHWQKISRKYRSRRTLTMCLRNPCSWLPNFTARSLCVCTMRVEPSADCFTCDSWAVPAVPAT